MDRDELVDIFSAMDINGLLRQSHLLTGEWSLRNLQALEVVLCIS